MRVAAGCLVCSAFSCGLRWRALPRTIIHDVPGLPAKYAQAAPQAGAHWRATAVRNQLATSTATGFLVRTCLPWAVAITASLGWATHHWAAGYGGPDPIGAGNVVTQ